MACLTSQLLWEAPFSSPCRALCGFWGSESQSLSLSSKCLADELSPWPNKSFCCLCLYKAHVGTHSGQRSPCFLSIPISVIVTPEYSIFTLSDAAHQPWLFSRALLDRVLLLVTLQRGEQRQSELQLPACFSALRASSVTRNLPLRLQRTLSDGHGLHFLGGAAQAWLLVRVSGLTWVTQRHLLGGGCSRLEMFVEGSEAGMRAA